VTALPTLRYIHGFIKTGTDLSEENLSISRWSLARQPHLLETSLPGVVAVGDARGGSIKRVASEVGEGSVAISLIQYSRNRSYYLTKKLTQSCWHEVVASHTFLKMPFCER
jgi:hypothetical protein